MGVKKFLGVAIVFAALTQLSACTENNREPGLSQITTVPASGSIPQSSPNISDPSLTVAENVPVVTGADPILVWSDEFDGNRLDLDEWFIETGDGSQYGIPGWGNQELQYYIPDGVRVANGVLTITARRETINGFNYTSARINTRDRFAFRYGRIEASIRLPSGQGLWPAFWMLAQDSPYGDWPASGEIDIVEAINLDGTPGPGGFGGGNEIFGTIHFGGGQLGRIISGETYVPSEDVTEGFHIYAVEWDETEIRWYFDETLYAVKNSWQSSAAPFPAPFDQPFYILLNMAVGGNFPGIPAENTRFPAVMQVDYVRVYSGDNTAPPTTPQAAAPTPTQDAADVISLFSDAYTNVTIDSWPTSWSVVGSVADITVDGSTVREHLDVDFVGVEFVSAPLDVSGMTHMHVDVWTPDAGSFLIKIVDFGGNGFGGGNDSEGPITFDATTTPALTQGEWVSLDISLADMQAAGLNSLTDINQLVIAVTPAGNNKIYIDNLYFYNDGS